MTKYIGDFQAGSVVRIKFNTLSQSLVPTTPSVAMQFAVYKNSTTEITAGVTVTTDYDGKAGLHMVVIDTSADPAYTTSEDYDVVFTAGTVDSKDLTRVVLRTFSLENRNRRANVIQIAGQTTNAVAAVTFPASVANETTVAARATQTSVDGKPTLAQIEGSTAIAKEATVATRATQSSVDQRPTLAQIEGSTILAKEATLASILTAIQNLNNLSAKINVFGSPLLEIPDTGSTVYAFTVIVKDDEDKLVNLDAIPTVTAANASGASRSGNLSAVSNPATGRYTFTYSVSDTHPSESLRISVSGAVFTEPRYIEWIGAVVNYDTLTVLQQISTDLAGKPNLAQIEGSAILAKESTVATRASQASLDGKPNLNQIEASTVLAKEQSVSSLLDRLGAFTGSGANTVLGFFRALFRKDGGTATPTDVGGTFSNATDSLEAIRDRGDEAWTTGSGGGGGAGTGARSVSITVLDQSATAIQSATVRVSRSGQTFAVQTNASGVALFSLDDSTWTVSITTPGYSFAPASLVVAGNVNQTYSMTQIAPTPPAPFAGLCNVQFSIIHLGLPVANATVVASLEDENPTVDNYLVSRQVTSGVTDLNGNCVLTMVQFSQFTRGGVYRIKVADSFGRTIHDRRIKVPTQPSANAEDLQDAR